MGIDEDIKAYSAKRRREYYKAYYEAHKEHYKEQRHKYYLATSEKVIGFKDSEFYYCYPDSVYSEVRKFYAAQDKSFPLGKSALFQQLATDTLIETGNGQTTKLKRIQGKRSRFLWLRAAALDAEEVTDE